MKVRDMTRSKLILHNTGTHTLLMMLKTRGSAPYLIAACDKERKNSQRNRKKRRNEISSDLHKFFIISGQFLAVAIAIGESGEKTKNYKQYHMKTHC